jgi:Protein of unknown function (DUF1207)
MSLFRGRWTVVARSAAVFAIAICASPMPARAEVQYEELPGTMSAPPVIDGTVASPPLAPPPTVVISGPPASGPVSFPVAEALAFDAPWSWQLMPTGLIWHSYLAGPKEPRMASLWNYQPGVGWLWSPTVGGRIGLLRYGTPNSFRPEGWQLDVEGAAFPELNSSDQWTMRSTDFRVGLPLSYGVGPLQMKFAVYHLSSHIGDQFLLENPGFTRVEYSRNALVYALSFFPTDNMRLYGEIDWAFYTNGATQPWQFQFGAEYSPIYRPGFRGSPFAAINGHLRQEVAFGGSLVAQVGWQWLNGATGTRIRLGFQYFNGKNEQYQFFNDYVQQFGIGLWYDF